MRIAVILGCVKHFVKTLLLYRTVLYPLRFQSPMPYRRLYIDVKPLSIKILAATVLLFPDAHYKII